MTSTLIRKAVAVAAGTGIALGGAAALAPSAGAAPVLSVAYDASGTSHIAKPNANVNLGPTTLTTNLNADGTFTGSLPLPPTSASFKVIGLVPVTSTVTFVPVGQVSGSLKGTKASATAVYYVKLSNVKLAGIPAFVGNNCQTASPVTINVATPAGQKFDILKGGTVAGTYTIGNFANCGLTTGLVNLLVPGSGNTVSFTLSNGRLAGS